MDARVASVLIVDDGQDVCQLLYDYLSQEGYNCVTALNGREALIQLALESFDIILLDIRLPDVSGLEILERIASSSNSIVPIVISGVDNAAAAIESTKRGAADYITKPFTLARVKDSIRRALKDVSHLPVTPGQQAFNALSNTGDNGSPDDEAFSQLDAIARGVQIRLETMFGLSRLVMRETAEIACQLGLPETAIQRWLKSRIKQDSDKIRDIERSLKKLTRSLAAQEALALMRPYIYTPENNEKRN